MPLVIVTGYPCSGKTRRALELATFLKERFPSKNIKVISEEDVGAHRISEYANSNLEKKARGNFFSSVERHTTQDTIVIADGLNYIKGYRYQLYCIARAASTPHCVLHCVVSETECQGRNQRLREEGASTYPIEIFKELLLRYEEPNNQVRWDSPLFTVGPDEDVDWCPITETLMGTVTRPPSMSTAVKTCSSAEFLASLDMETQKIVEKISAHIRTVGIPTNFKLGDNSLIIRQNILNSDLQRLRRQFIHMNRLHQIDSGNVESTFIQYLQNHFK